MLVGGGNRRRPLILLQELLVEAQGPNEVLLSCSPPARGWGAGR